MRRVRGLRNQTGAWHSDLKYTRDRAAACNIFASSLHSDHARRLNSTTRDFIFAQCFDVMMMMMKRQ